MLKVGLKYCGGCRAQYDRERLVEYIRERLGGTVQFVSYENSEAQAFLIVTGCLTACPHPVSRRRASRLHHLQPRGRGIMVQENAGRLR